MRIVIIHFALEFYFILLTVQNLRQISIFLLIYFLFMTNLFMVNKIYILNYEI